MVFGFSHCFMTIILILCLSHCPSSSTNCFIRRGLLSLDWKSIGITDVYSVANGVEAKELLLSTSIDLVIFDIRMPGFSGLELAQMVKERSMDVAVVVLSGFSEFEYARSAMRYGVYEYLLKPVSPNELMETRNNA